MSNFPVFDPASPQAEAIRDLFVQVLWISGVLFNLRLTGLDRIDFERHHDPDTLFDDSR
ncbi:hypothetical protein N9018_04450 [Rhodopirellula sp.]|nr:hypothetical protein [Rhodopirellula sp.]